MSMYNMSCVCHRDGHKINARVAQLVEHDLAKVGAAGSSPVSRFHIKKEWLQKEALFFTSSPAVGSKFEVSAAASVVAKRCPLDTSYVSRFHIKRERLQKGITLFYFESCRGLVAKKEVQFERDYNAKRYPVSIRLNFLFFCENPTENGWTLRKKCV